jgi:hypothetical protein
VKVPYVVVSAKGVANGLSEEYNDGWDFGPDSYDPTSTANPPYTQTSGTQEATLYAQTALRNSNENVAAEVYLMDGTYYLSASVQPSHISGAVGNKINYITSSWLKTTITATEGGFPLFTFSPDYGEDIIFENIAFAGASTNGGTTAVVQWLNTNAPQTIKRFTHCYFENSLNYGAYYGYGGGYLIFDGCFFDATGIFNVLNPGMDTIIFRDSIIKNATNPGYIATAMNVSIDRCIIELGTGQSMLSVSSAITQLSVTNSVLGRYGAQQYVLIVQSGATVNAIYFDYLISLYPDSSYNAILNNGTIDFMTALRSFYGNGSGGTGTFVVTTSPTTTPAVPASGTAQQNTNPYAVDVYIYGGDVTEIQITRNGTAYTVLSVSTAIAMSGQVYKLNPTDSITVTYSTAPDWTWLSD